MKSPGGPSILGRPSWEMIVIPLSPSVKIARVPSPSSRVMDAPAAAVHPLAATTITSGGLLLLSVSTPLAAVPGGIPPSWAPAGTTRRTRTTPNTAKTAPTRETAPHPQPQPPSPLSLQEILCPMGQHRATRPPNISKEHNPHQPHT